MVVVYRYNNSSDGGILAVSGDRVLVSPPLLRFYGDLHEQIQVVVGPNGLVFPAMREAVQWLQHFGGCGWC